MEEKSASVKFTGLKFDLLLKQIEESHAHNVKAIHEDLDNILTKCKDNYEYQTQKELLSDYLRLNEINDSYDLSEIGKTIQIRNARKWLSDLVIEDIKLKSEKLSDKAFHLYIDTYATSIGYEAQYTSGSGFQDVLDYIIHVYQIYQLQLPEHITDPVEHAEMNETEEVNIFNGMPMSSVRKYFNLLAIMRNGQGQSFMEPEDVDLFIQRAFTGTSDIPKVKIRKGARDGAYIQKLFYEYWQSCKYGDRFISQGGNTQQEYLKLLTDNIEGFDFESLSANFHKTKYTKKKIPQVNITW
jgi:hypothetical protein